MREYLEVAMSDSAFVDVLDDVDHLANVKYSDFLRQLVDVVLDEVSQVAALAVFQHEVEAVFVLKRVT